MPDPDDFPEVPKRATTIDTTHHGFGTILASCPIPGCDWEYGEPVTTEDAGQAVRLEELGREHMASHSPTERAQAKPSARIDAELAKGQETERKLQAILEAAFVWRDRPSGDIGLAMQLATILGNDVAVPPASAALVRVLKEVDRLERQARHDRDEATLEALRRIREAADTTTPEPATPATPAPPGS